jgi:hypothetical protein
VMGNLSCRRPPKRGGYSARIETRQSAGVTPRDAAAPQGEVDSI